MPGQRRRNHAFRKTSQVAAAQGENRGASRHVRHKRGAEERLLDPSRELEVLKCIMVREGYLARVTRLAEDMARRAKRHHGQPQALPPGMVDLLDLLRVSTLDAIEAISLWRLSQVTPTPAPFEWNGQNYLLKMLHDCDFLDRVDALRSWLGFRVSGNPFFFPQQSRTGLARDSEVPNQANNSDVEFDTIGLADVGRQPWLGPLEFEIVDDIEGADRAKGARPKRRRLKKMAAYRTVAPYAAAVVNDLTLLPPVKEPSPTRSRSSKPARLTEDQGGPPRKEIVDIESLVPNLVPREDARRISVARQALLDEQQRVVAAARASEAVEGEGGSRRRSRAPSTVVEAALGTSRRDSRACPTPSFVPPSKRRISQFGHQSTRRNGSTVGSNSPDAQKASGSPETGGMSSIVLTTAGLLEKPTPEPHPALGPVLLQSDRPGGELHPNPFLYTVTEAETAKADLLEPPIVIQSPSMITRDRCLTAPTATASPSSTGDTTGDCQEFKNPRRSCADDDRPVTAPATTPSKSADGFASSQWKNRSVHASQQGRRSRSSVSRASCGEVTTAQGQTEGGKVGLGHSSRGLRLSRKAGAELRALTAAGTSGRRQPPPREMRLRRLARDVARHSAELRRLFKEESQLRKSLACCFGRFERSGDEAGRRALSREGGVDAKDWGDGGDAVAAMVAVRNIHGAAGEGGVSVGGTASPGPAPKTIEAALEAKRREIELKTFDLEIRRDELRCLRIVQKQERKRKLALEMERRRVDLDEGQRLPEDEAVAETLEDTSCILIQKRIRGNAGRKYAAWYKRKVNEDATTIQRGVRFIWDRRATRRRLLLNASARPMQAAIRMFVKRQRYKRLLRQKRELFAACKLQVVCRGMLGRRRAEARRSMIAAATKALDWVSLENLLPRHLKELARAIHGALVDPVRQFPPAGVLGALRVTLTILDDADDASSTKCATGGSGGDGGGKDGMDMVTFRTALGKTVRAAVSAPDLTWEMAARVLGRPFRLLRRMRAFASGLGATSDKTPARLMRLSPEAARLLAAYRGDPSWSFEALSAVEEGGTAAKAFIGWAMELEKVYREQPRVQRFLSDGQPSWLRKGRSFQKRRRALELHAESCRQAVAAATEYRQHLQTQGRAYGDAVVAKQVLDKQCEEAEEAVRQLELKRRDFLEFETKVEAEAGRALREDVEFAEREASVASREEEMAARVGQSGPEELEALAGKTRDCGVVVRELVRRLRVWERRCHEEKRPLLEEWVPPTEAQSSMARALGEVRAWKQITVAQRARLLEDVGGSRYVKGVVGKDLEIWRRAAEGLEACGADIESGETRLAEFVDRFERELARINADIAAEKVRSAPWDNATEGTRALERQEDADAARDERRTAMGATLPPGMLDSPSPPRQHAQRGQPLSSSSCRSSRAHDPQHRQPTLLLLGLDLPVAVRGTIRAGLDRDAPDLFGRHVVGADALPSLASAAQVEAAVDHRFFEPCRGLGAAAATAVTAKAGSGDTSTGNIEKVEGPVDPGAGERPGAGGSSSISSSSSRGRGEEPYHSHGAAREGRDTSAAAAATGEVPTRASVVQAALADGKSVSLEVVPGPGLWARGRFLRDLEALLGGLDTGGGGGGGGGGDDRTREGSETSGAGRKKRAGPTVLLLEGHSRNRSGGGSDLSHGTKFMGEVVQQRGAAGDGSEPDVSLGVWPLVSLAARRTKVLLEEAAQCLHDLSNSYGETPSPFKAILATRRTASSTEDVPQRKAKGSWGGPDEASVAHGILVEGYGSTVAEASNSSLAAEGSPGMELLLAACHIITHPDRRYDVGENLIQSSSSSSSRPATALVHSVVGGRTHERVPSNDTESENAAILAYASCLAKACRAELSEARSARGVAGALRGSALEAVPLETAVALRRLVHHPCWPATSPRPDFAECPASEAFVGWIMAAVAAGTELALDGGGGLQETEVGSNQSNQGDWPAAEQEERRRERGDLRGIEAALVDEIITVVDDDSPWLLPLESTRGGRDAQNRRWRQCRSSEALNTLMETVLRPFNVFEARECKIQRDEAGSSCRSASPASDKGDRFSVTISRAFGSIYARAVSLGTGRLRKGLAVMARTRDEELIPLLAPNWMEKHDLSALRELRTQQAVWRALVTTLALRYPNEAVGARPASISVAGGQEAGDSQASASASTATASDPPRRRGSAYTPGSPPPGHSSFEKCTAVASGGLGGTSVLSFRHDRRLTLETSCLLMGRVVPVYLFEESRSDFWCEAEMPGDLLAAASAGGVGGGCARPPCPVGLRVPKECIPLILDDGHPMRMQTILDDADLRHLSVLIADRLKLCRVGSAQRGPRSYRFWLDGALGGDPHQSATRGSSAEGGGEGGAAEKRDREQAGREFKLSLRKRSVGQIVFSRLVSFWVPSSDESVSSSGGCDTGAVRKYPHGGDDERPTVSSLPAAGNFVRRLVVVKEFSHRGECGELRGQIHDSGSGGGSEAFVLAPELTGTLLGDWLRKSKRGGRNKSLSARYWRDALTWRLGIAPEPPVRGNSIHEQTVDRNEGLEDADHVPLVPRTGKENGELRMTVDERTPLFSLRRVAARVGIPPAGVDNGDDEAVAEPAALFDLLVLPPLTETACPRRNGARARTPAIELVATHRQTMAVFAFSIPIKAFIKGVDAVVAACLSTPTALSTELELPASDTALRDLAERWLRYSRGDGQSGLGDGKTNLQPTLTLSFPGRKDVVAEPRVSLRCSVRNAHPVGRKPGLEPNGIVKADDCTAAATVREGGTSSCQAAGRKRGSQEERGSMARQTKRRSSLGNIATLQVDTRNERMVFKRSVAVPRSGQDVHERRQASDSPERPGQSEEEGGSEGGGGGSSTKVFAVSVYEVFSAGPTGRIRRHLRFCARDESVRPVVEASTAVPWAGTCEGVEGGRLWRVVMEGLSFGYVRNRTGGRLKRMSLHVSTDVVAESEAMVDGSLDAAEPDGRDSVPGTATSSSGACDDHGGLRNMTVAEDPSVGGRGPYDVGRGDRKPLNVLAEGDLEDVRQELSVAEHSLPPPGGVLDKVVDSTVPPDQHEKGRVKTADEVGPQRNKDESVRPAGYRHSPKIHPLRTGGERGSAACVTGAEPGVCRNGNLYSGWHRITGVRLHVQCFLEEDNTKRGVHIHDPSDDEGNGDGNGNVDGKTAERRPAGRGGAVGIPTPATLRFLLCDPRSGYRTGVEVSADDVRRNLSNDGGIVQAGLLDAGRRPALAQAIAQKLRLVFDASGGYRVILPLPVEWNRRCRQTG